MPSSVPPLKTIRDIANNNLVSNRRLLSPDVLVTIFSHLSVPDILSVRKSCKALDRATRDKLLWVYILRNAVIEKQIPLPPYMKSLASLSAHQLECLARRALRFSLDLEHDILAARKTASLNLPQSVTWLGIVGGRWLFVAASDTRTSTFSCWTLSDVFEGSSKPLAECYLPGPVHDGEVEMQDGGVVIAISVGSSSPFIDIISLRMSGDECVFVRLAQAPDCTYVRMLQEDWLGFALKDEISIPHIFNWRTGETHALGELPDVHGASLSIALWRECVVVTRPRDILIYSMPSESNAPSLLRILSLDDCLDIYEPVIRAVVIPKSSIVSTLNELLPTSLESDYCDGLQILITAEATVFALSLHVGIDEGVSGGQSFNLESSVATPWCEQPQRDYGPQWFHKQGSAGRRVAFLAYSIEGGIRYTVVDLFLPWIRRQTIGESSGPPLRELRHAEDLSTSTWGFLMHDFDDALGVFVLGDVFGNITLLDVVEGETRDFSGLSEMMRNGEIGEVGDLTPLSKDPLDIPIPFVIDVLLAKNEVEDTKRAPVKVFEDIPAANLPPNCSTDWSNYFHLDKWQGLPNDRDNLWRFQHLSNVKGRPQLLFYNTESDVVYFKIGGLIYREEYSCHVLPVSLTVSDLIAIFREEQESGYLYDTEVEFHWSADAATEIFELYVEREIMEGRDRRQEQVARGGFPTVDLFAEVKGLRPVALVPTGETWSIMKQPQRVAYDSDSDSDNSHSHGNDPIGISVRESGLELSDDEDLPRHTVFDREGHSEARDLHRKETGTESGLRFFNDDQEFPRETAGSERHRAASQTNVTDASDGSGKDEELPSNDEGAAGSRNRSDEPEKLGAHGALVIDGRVNQAGDDSADR